MDLATYSIVYADRRLADLCREHGADRVIAACLEHVRRSEGMKEEARVREALGLPLAAKVA